MLCLLVVFLISGALGYEIYLGDDFEEKWFEQYLDHFDARDNRTFFMRYYEIDSFYQPGGPLLLEIGGEVTVDPSSLALSPTLAVARRLGGKIVLLEHRYYGSSAPFENITDTEDYKYLSAEQALEDIAHFIEKYKKLAGLSSSKVAVFGCSYAGTLATWMRYKFPHLVDAAWASSAPIRIVLDFYQYYEVAAEIYSNVSSECIAMIRQGYREAKAMLGTPEGEKTIKTVFDGWECGNVTEMSGPEILATMRMVLSNQYSKPNHGVESCRFLQGKNSSTTPFQQLAAFILQQAGNVCFDEDLDDLMAWSYQTCSQFGFSFTTTSYNQPFKDTYSSIEADLKFCADAFGNEFDLEALQRSIDRMNRVYGGGSLKVTKVVTFHGKQDPWSAMGLNQEMNKDTPVFLVPGASHCADMSKSEDDAELPLLHESRKKAINIMKTWLQ